MEVMEILLLTSIIGFGYPWNPHLNHLFIMLYYWIAVLIILNLVTLITQQSAREMKLG